MYSPAGMACAIQAWPAWWHDQPRAVSALRDDSIRTREWFVLAVARGQRHRGDGKRGVVTRAELAERVLQACLNWVDDTGDCHFCDHEGLGNHDDDCPLRRLPEPAESEES